MRQVGYLQELYRYARSTEQKIHYILKDELHPVCHLQALLGAYRILHVFRIRAKLRLFSKSQKI